MKNCLDCKHADLDIYIIPQDPVELSLDCHASLSKKVKLDIRTYIKIPVYDILKHLHKIFEQRNNCILWEKRKE